VLHKLVLLPKNGILLVLKEFLMFRQRLLTNGTHGEEVYMNLHHFFLRINNS